ncbi:MAG: 4Fe-4S dicluster domain-containing protein [Eubacteriales bacterium]
MKKIALSKLNDFFAAIAAEEKLYLPVDGEKGADYKLWNEGVTYSGALNTNRSAKDFFFPQTENIVDFKREGKTIEVIDTRTEAENFVIFGVRACDARSFTILDKVFLAEPVDSFYASRRAHGTIVTMACTRPGETCFCGTFGIDMTEPEGDVACWIAEDALWLKANTEKGEALLERVAALTEEGDASAVDAQKAAVKEIAKKLPLQNLPTEAFKGDVLLEKFDSAKWPELSKACLGCGTCTFVCPTCQCYDIFDFDTGHGVKRARCWDSCMYSDFTRMAHGNSRNSQVERFRQRFMHKLVYFPMNNGGEFGCVGCGRCLAKCPINMNIVKVMKSLGGDAE